MSKVDWSLAPEGAQIYSPEFGDCNAVWYKVDGGKVLCWPVGSTGWSWRHKMIGELIYRPEPQPKPWSGPEDGLPPIGIECEFSNIRVTVIAHVDQPHCREEEYKTLAVGQKGDRGQIVMGSARCFKPAKTPEQIAAESRETAIRELMDIAQVDCRVTAARLVDAGFKRELV